MQRNPTAAIISFETVLFQNNFTTQQKDQLEPWAKQWHHYASRLYFDTYFDAMNGSNLLPAKDNILPLTQLFLFEKAIYELGYELNNRVDWVGIPLTGVLQFINNYLDE